MEREGSLRDLGGGPFLRRRPPHRGPVTQGRSGQRVERRPEESRSTGRGYREHDQGVDGRTRRCRNAYDALRGGSPTEGPEPSNRTSVSSRPSAAPSFSPTSPALPASGGAWPPGRAGSPLRCLGRSSARRRISRSRSRASSRLADWDRVAELTMMTRPSPSSWMPSVARTRALTGPGSAAVPARSKRRSPLVATLFTFWPPGPPERLAPPVQVGGGDHDVPADGQIVHDPRGVRRPTASASTRRDGLVPDRLPAARSLSLRGPGTPPASTRRRCRCRTTRRARAAGRRRGPWRPRAPPTLRRSMPRRTPPGPAVPRR